MGSKLDRAIDAAPQLLLVFGMGAAAIPFSLWLVFWGRGSVEHLTWVLMPAVVGAPMLLIASAGLWLLGRRTPSERARKRLAWGSAAALGLAAFAVVVAPSYLPGRLLNYGDVRAARSYCMMLVPRLEAVKRDKGAYPSAVRDLMPEGRPVPRLLRTRQPFYRTVGAAFEFVIHDPSGWDSGHYYFSEDVPLRGHWERW